ncbi:MULTISPECIES: hypothetical protein [Sphingomonas]|uniref:hypothetical protein n=1 Tax=Sphingomonas TaxID=13687 RepID=UPI00126A0E3F|nr:MULTISPECIES: hypothetical protein [Sphingomonas]
MGARHYWLGAVVPLLLSAAPALAQSAPGDLGNFLRSNSGTLTSGSTVNGALESGDLVRTDGTFADGYLYNGQAGERLTVTLRSKQFDTWLVVDDPNSSFRETNDDGYGGTDSRMTVTLPRTATYIIAANSLSKGATGSYSLTVQSDRAPGATASSSGSSGSGSGELSTMYARGGLPRIAIGQSLSGQLTNSDFLRSDGTYADGYLYTATAGEKLKITLRSSQFDSWLVVDEPNGPYRETNDDGGGGNDSQMIVTIPRSGPYLIVANTVSKGVTGSYTLSLSRP